MIRLEKKVPFRLVNFAALYDANTIVDLGIIQNEIVW